MRTVVVIPMKDAAVSKTRLAPAMPAVQRERMALALFRRALDFFGAQFPRFERLVVTPSARIGEVARACGASVLMEGEPAGLNPAVASAFAWARQAGFERMLVVPGDIPVWLRSELDELLQEGASSPVVIARAHDGGTNALLIDLKRAARFDFHYGSDSASRHAQAAQAAGLSAMTRTWPFLSRDIDTADDCLLFKPSLEILTNGCDHAS